MNAAQSIKRSAEIADDRTAEVDYERLVSEEIEEYDNIEVTTDLREGGIHAQAPWAEWFSFLNRYVMGRSLQEEVVAFCRLLRTPPRLLSLGCGYGGIELAVARRLRELGVEFELVAVDLNDHLFAKCREVTAQEQLPIVWEAVDLNFVELESSSFDLMFAHASLHHILNLEHLFAQLATGLRPGGRLIVHDLIGEAQTLFWRDNVEFVREVVRDMPERFKGGLTIEELVPEYRPPDLQVGMEGIRQEEILDQLNSFFEPVVLHKFGAIMRMVCTHPVIGTSIDMSNAADLAYLEDLFRLDLELVRTSRLRPTEMFGVFVERPAPLVVA